MFTIKSVSKDGVWYLVNHWTRYRAFWQEKDQCTPDTLFTRLQDANRSLTMLLQDMPEYKTDTFIPVRIEWDNKHNCYNFYEM